MVKVLSFSVEEYSVLYDLINIAEQSFHESDDEDERESIRETLESAYSVLIGHEEELPEEDAVDTYWLLI